MDHEGTAARDYGTARGLELVYPISQDILYNPRVGAESGYDPVVYRPVWRPPPARLPTLPPKPKEEPLVAHDWGHLGRQLIGGWLGGGQTPATDFDYGGQVGGGAGDPTGAATGMATSAPAVTGGLGPESCEGMIWTGGVPPKGYKVVHFCGQGVLRKVRRRRRRRLLTASDKADISYIVATTGKGQLAASLIHRSAQ